MSGMSEHGTPTPPIGRRRFGRRGAWLIAILLLLLALALVALVWSLFAPEAETPRAAIGALLGCQSSRYGTVVRMTRGSNRSRRLM